MVNQELFNVLVVESREHLSRIEPELLDLEQKGPAASKEKINSIFRAVHSIKGGFSFFGCERLVRLAHDIEAVLARIRVEKLSSSPEVVDALLKGIDRLRVLVDNVAQLDTIDTDEELGALAPYIESDTKAPSAPAPTPVAAAVPASAPPPLSVSPQYTVSLAPMALPPETLRLASRHGKRVYQVAARAGVSRESGGRAWRELFADWQKYADVLACEPARGELEKRDIEQTGTCDAVVALASVLEPDLLVRALQVSPECICERDTRAPADIPPAAAPPAPESTPAAPTGAAEQSVKAIRNSPRAPAAAAPAQSGSGDGVLWVRVDILDSLMNLAGELVLARNQLVLSCGQRLIERGESDAVVARIMQTVREQFAQSSVGDLTRLESRVREILQRPLGEINGLSASAQRIDTVTTSLQEKILRTRMQPLSILFRSFPRVVRDTARALDKKAVLVQQGQDVEVDRSIIDHLGDPLTHLVRNCIAHGIESPQARIDKGKPAEGTVRMRAFQEEGKVVVEVQDDGAGIDPARIRDSAIAKGVISADEAAGMNDQQLRRLIFVPGFSTMEKADDYAGRGVGMDVVKTNVERLGGAIEIDSEVGVGTVVSLRLPLTLAIMPSLVVCTEGRRFAIPQVTLEEVARIRGDEISARVERVHTYEVLRLREQLLPLVRLARVLGIEPTYKHPQSGERATDMRERWSERRGAPLAGQTDDERRRRSDRRNALGDIRVAILRAGTRRFGLVVDEVHDNEEIVVKPLPDLVKQARCYSGATIMGDGSVAMILEPSGIADMAGLRFEEIQKSQNERIKKQVPEAPEDEILLFSLGGPERFAVRIGAIQRIEKRQTDEIQTVGEREFVRSQESSLEVFRVEDYIPVRKPPQSTGAVFVVVPRGTGAPMGFRAAHIADTVRTHLNVDSQALRAPGVSGTAVVGGQMVVVLDMPALVESVEKRNAGTARRRLE